MVNSIKIGKVIYSLLSVSGTTLFEYVGNRIYPLIAEQTTNYPFIVYYRTNISTNNYNKDGICSDAVGFTVVVVSNDYSDSIEIANEVRKTLEKKKIVDELMTIYNCHIVNVDESFNDNAYVQTLQFECEVEK